MLAYATTRRVEHASDIGGKLLPEPAVKRHAEASLRAAEDLVGQQIGHRRSQDPLERQSSRAHLRRNAEGHFRKLAVEERSANLECMSHAHAIDLREQVVQ